MSAIMGITLAVCTLLAALFVLGICSAAARPIPKAAARTNGHRHSRRQRHETIAGESPHLDRFGRRRWLAFNFVRHHQRQLVSGPAGEKFGQGQRVLADEALKTRASFRNHLRSR